MTSAGNLTSRVETPPKSLDIDGTVWIRDPSVADSICKNFFVDYSVQVSIVFGVRPSVVSSALMGSEHRVHIG